MSIQNNFPALKPTLLLDFANTKELDPRITFTRASTATYYGTQSAKAEENLMVQSQDLSTTWLPTNTVVTSNSTLAPDNTSTADTLADNATSASHIISQSPILTAGTVYTFSVFLKANTNNFAVVTLTNTTTVQNGISAVVDLSTGAITQTATGTSATFTSSSITASVGGWYRVVITGSSVAGFTRAEVGLVPASTGNTFSITQRVTYVGTGTSVYVWGAQLEQRSSVTAYTVTTTQAITNYIPVLETAASGVARFDHNPVTDESLGLLIEESRTNLLTYSEQFADASWTKTRSTITANTIVAPNGTLTADTFTDTVDNNTHILRTATITSAPTTSAVTATIYVKNNNQSNLFILYITGDSDSSTYGRVASTFNLSTGTIAGSSSVNGATFTSNNITPVGNGWYRCSVTGIVGSTGSPTGVRFVAGFATIANGSVASAYAGSEQSVFIWGTQLEAGAAATSYIPTVASQVTRAADAASMTGTNFSSWYNQAEGAFFSSVVLSQTPAVLSGVGIYAVSDGTTSNRVFVNLGTGAGGNINTVVSLGGALQAQTINAGLSTAGAYSYANSYKVNDFASVVNNGVAVTDTSGIVPVVNRLYLGAGATGTGYLNSTIKKIAYYPIRVTNAQLQALTS